MPEPPTGTVTFLFTDIQGSTRLWERSPEAMQSALARHDEILHDAIESFGGYVFKTVGDAFCAAFPTAPDALQAALASQRALLREEWGEEIGSLQVRMALHTGAAEERGGDYFGPPLNRVARLLSAGHGGQVLLSGVSEGLLRDELAEGAELQDLGEHRLKDLTRPERIFQLVAPGLPAEFPSLSTLDGRRNNLPAQLTPLVGRERELAEVSTLVRHEGVRLLTLTGPGGTGKTRLGLQAAAELVDEFDGGSFFVALAPVTDPELVAPTIAGSLGVTESGERSLAEDLEEYLREKELLLLLDNFEQVTEAAPLVGGLLASCPRLKVVATSRGPLRVYGEREYPVPPLALPDPDRLPPVETITQYEAVRLFIERARAVKPDFEVTNESAPAVAEICVRLDGLPLAIELAAARTRMLSPQGMLERLQNRLKLLRGGSRDLPERQQTLKGAIDWSHDLLEEGERALFRRLSVFSGGCTLEAAEAVCDSEGDLDVDVLDGLESLMDKSLIRQEEGPGGEPRFSMLETIREYAAERLEEGGEAEALERAHAEFFLALAEEAEPELTGPDQMRWLDRLEIEHDNMRAALSWSLGGGDTGLGLRLTGVLLGFWLTRGHFSEGREWLERALDRDDAEPAAARAKALFGLSTIAYELGDYEGTEASIEEALTLYRELGDRKGITDSLVSLGFTAMQEGDHGRATALLEESLSLARGLGDEWSIAAALNGLASVSSDRGEYDRAEALWEEALALSRKRGDTRQISTSLFNMGYGRVVRGDYEGATSLLEECLALGQESKDRTTVAVSRLALGLAAARQGDEERARALFGESLVLSRELGDKLTIAELLEGFAELAGALGDGPREARLWGAAVALREALGAPWSPAERELHEPYLEAARSRLDEEAWEEGRSMTLEEAVAYALEEQG